MTNLNSNSMKYRVLVDGEVLNESPSRTMADVFVSSLDESIKARVSIVPVIDDGRLLLLD